MYCVTSTDDENDNGSVDQPTGRRHQSTRSTPSSSSSPAWVRTGHRSSSPALDVDDSSSDDDVDYDDVEHVSFSSSSSSSPPPLSRQVSSDQTAGAGRRHRSRRPGARRQRQLPSSSSQLAAARRRVPRLNVVRLAPINVSAVDIRNMFRLINAG